MTMRTILRAAVIILVATMASTGLPGQATTPPPQTFSTTIYFDWTANLTKDGTMTGTPAAQALNNKFVFRRAYFTYENKISDTLKFRFRYDADNTANITAVNFVKSSTSKDDKLRPFVKHIYLEWSRDWLQSKFNIGMIETLSFKLAEDRWGLRSVAKTLLDGYKDVTGVEIDQTSADLGVTWKGTLARPLRFGVGVHNGSHYSHPETDKFKKFSGYLQLVPVAGLNISGFADYEKQNDSAKAMTYKLDAYFDMVKNLNVSFEWFRYDNETYKNADGSHYNVGGWSVFGSYKIKPEKIMAFARFDRYEVNSMGSANDRSLVILGLDWFAWGATGRLQPNIWIHSYGDSAKKTDIVFNMTFFLSF